MTGAAFKAVDLGDTAWRQRGFCSGETEAFFPHRGEARRAIAAKAVCLSGCPVIDECLEFALTNNERFGVWGGKGEEERRRIRRKRRQQLEAAVPAGMKRCSACELVKPPKDFHRDNSTHDGLNPRCAECRTAYTAARPKAS